MRFLLFRNETKSVSEWCKAFTGLDQKGCFNKCYEMFHGDPALQRDNSTTPIHFSFLHELGISFIHTLNSQQD